jgi:hypothetical protein
MNFTTTTPLWPARNHNWLVCGVISTTVAGMPRRHKTGEAIKKPGQRGPGFACVEAGAEARGLIFGDDWVGIKHVELVAEPGLHLVLLQPTVPVKEFVRG